MDNKIRLPIGRSDYKTIIDNGCLYIDKTGMIADVIDNDIPVSLFTRPRRFGKTLNMSMLRTFFEKEKESSARYFENKIIWQMGEKYRREQGKYPIIYLSFKDVKYKSFDLSYGAVISLIADEFGRHREIMPVLSDENRVYYKKILEKKATQNEYGESLRKLSEFLNNFYGEPVVLLIDEYDTPLQNAYIEGYYDDMISFIRPFLSGGLKDNANLKYAFLTGIMRVAKESVFSGLNNLCVYSILDEKFSTYFGFTAEDVGYISEKCNVQEKLPEIREWYDGYIFGNTEMYNPWSVLSYLDSGCLAVSHWGNTSSNDILRQSIKQADSGTIGKIRDLYDGKTVKSIIDPSISYGDMQKNKSLVFSFLAISGYMKCFNRQIFDGKFYCDIEIPNREIKSIYKEEIIGAIEENFKSDTATLLVSSLVFGDVDSFASLIKKYLESSVSFFDNNESFYHGMILGMCVATTNYYKVLSNRESGEGRFDIALFPLQQN